MDNDDEDPMQDVTLEIERDRGVGVWVVRVHPLCMAIIVPDSVSKKVAAEVAIADALAYLASQRS